MLRFIPNNSYSQLKNLSLLLLGVGVLAGIVVEMGFGWDFANFYDAGHKVLVGQVKDLYNKDVTIEGELPQGRMPFLGTPLSASFYTFIAWLPPRVALLVFKIQNTVAYFLGLFLLYRHCNRFSVKSSEEQAKFASIYCFVLLIYQPFWTIYRVGGQTTPTVFLFFVIALSCYTSGRFFFASLLLVLAVVVKPAFILALGFLTLISDLRFMRHVVALGLGVILVSVLAFGLDIHQEFLNQVLIESRNHKAWLYNSSLSVALHNWLLFIKQTGHGNSSLLTASILITRLGILTFFIWLLFRSRSEDWPNATRRHFNFLMSIIFSLMALPIIWEHYLALLFIPLACILSHYHQLSRNALNVILMVILFSIGQNLALVLWLSSYVGFDSLPALLAAGLFKSSPLLLMLVFLWKYHDELFRIHTISSLDVSS